MSSQRLLNLVVEYEYTRTLENAKKVLDCYDKNPNAAKYFDELHLILIEQARDQI